MIIITFFIALIICIAAYKIGYCQGFNQGYNHCYRTFFGHKHNN